MVPGHHILEFYHSGRKLKQKQNFSLHYHTTTKIIRSILEDHLLIYQHSLRFVHIFILKASRWRHVIIIVIIDECKLCILQCTQKAGAEHTL